MIPGINLIMPIGISYYIFKKISYILDVYRGIIKPESNFIKFALYISFFPQIIAGPIDRAKNLISQFEKNTNFDPDRIVKGMRLFLWGLFKKVVVADRLALYVNPIFNNPQNFDGFQMIIAVIFFSIQIYTDFSGYTDMAIGISLILGFKISENFDDPYFAKSINEFWRKWHITLTKWLMDYIFLPLAYSISRKIKKPSLLLLKADSWAYLSAAIFTMLICGFWHGPKWTYIFWGGLHGLLLTISFFTKKIRKKIRKRILKIINRKYYIFFRIGLTFFSVSFLWVFFRANSLSKAFYIYKKIFSSIINFSFLDLYKFHIAETGLNKYDFIIILIIILFLSITHLLKKNESLFSNKKILIRWVFYVIITIAILNLGVFTKNSFIYMQF